MFRFAFLGGGNDSQSTLIPYTDSFYYSRRPNLAVPAASVLQIGRDRSNAALGLHPRLSGIRQIFDGGRLALLQRTGYPNQSRSHFQGTDIWATSSSVLMRATPSRVRPARSCARPGTMAFRTERRGDGRTA